MWRSASPVNVGNPPDWTVGSRAALDLAMAGAGALLVGLGLVMAAQDYASGIESAKAAQALGFPAPFDPSHRLPYVPWLLGLAVFLGVGSVWRAIRARQSRRLRRHGGRSVWLLLAGSTVLDAAYYLDTTFGLDAPYEARALFIAPLYSIAGFLVAGSAWRLATLIRPLAPGDPDP